MSIKAKELLKNKFWIVENEKDTIGMLSINEQNKYVLSNSTGTKYFSQIEHNLKSSLVVILLLLV